MVIKNNLYEIMSIRNTIVWNKQPRGWTESTVTTDQDWTSGLGHGQNSPRRGHGKARTNKREEAKNRRGSMNIYMIRILEGNQRQNKRE